MENKEDFCLACLAAPMALFGAGSAFASSSMSSKDKSKKKKQILFWMSIGTIIVSAILFIIWLIIRKNCTSCKLT
jgi:hypothetical protein